MTTAEFTSKIEERRRLTNAVLDPMTRAELGQFMTPAMVSRTLAECISTAGDELHLLDPGAGIGSLTAAVVARLIDADERPGLVSLTAYEIDPTMRVGLSETLAECVAALTAIGVSATSQVVAEDFVEAAIAGKTSSRFTAAILNPPFMKLSARGETATRLRSRGWSPANLYTAFWSAAIDAVKPGGDIVAITPRSFCNGSYFAGFRRLLLTESALRTIHVFESRDKAFSDDGVLQETLVTHSVRGAATSEVSLSLSREPGKVALSRVVDVKQVVHTGDRNAFIRLPLDAAADSMHEWMGHHHQTLADLDIKVSTGPVVDFRMRAHLRQDAEQGTVPLFYPTHLTDGSITWPKASRKPNAFTPGGAEKLLTPKGDYCLVKRFSAKEERRRVVASYYDGSLGTVALENHLNYFHRGGQPLEDWLARGLTMFLNSTAVDAYFREFNGHTQVNAGDLRSLHYPDLEQLRILGKSWKRGLSQEDIDAAVASI